ncbi:MAG: hypothetical protein ACT4QD_10280 [Acidobacteriota bacterium]
MKQFPFLASLLTALLMAAIVFRSTTATGQGDRPPTQAPQFNGQVISVAGAGAAGGTPPQPGRPVPGATVHLVPLTAMDLTTRMTASAIYQAPYPAEAYDEPLEDAIRLRGKEFPQATTDSQGRFVIAVVPEGRFFIHVTPGPKDAEHLPGGDVSRRSYSAGQLRGQSMAIRVSSSPSAAAAFAGSSACLACHKDNQSTLAADRAQAGMDRPWRPGADAGFLSTPRLLRRPCVIP